MATSSVHRLFAGALAALVVLAGAIVAAPATAAPPQSVQSGQTPTSEPGAAGPSTEATVVDMIHTSGLYGGTVPAATAQTPYPTSGLQNQRSVSTAQIVLDDPASPQDILTYCIDLDTETTIGVHYELGTWTEANVPNLPYVQWILNNSYPQVPGYPASGTDAEKVRAVQGAIWYFTDQFVVSTFYPQQRAAVRAIVEAAQAALGSGTPPAPVLPTLEITPATLEGALPGDLVGPFTVSGTVPDATVRLETGTELYADAGGTTAVPDGATVAPGAQLWARYDPDISPEGFTLETTAVVPAGNVFLYDGNNPPRTSAQKLVLAAEATVPIRATASVVPPPAGVGTVRVDLVITGASAGDQGEIEVTATCVDGADSLVRTANLPAGLAAGTHTVLTVGSLPDGTSCTVTQPQDGATSFVSVTTSISPVPQTITAGTTSVVEVTDTYSAPTPPTGTFRVDLTVDGAAAGQQGEMRLVATCSTSSTVLVRREITVPAGFTGAAVSIATLADVPLGAECTVVQTVDGRNASAQLASSVVDPTTVTITGTNAILVTDTFVVPTPPTGTVAVDVTIAGAAAGQQGALALTATCTLNGADVQYPMTVAAGATGTVRALAQAGVVAESRCTVSQTADGGNPRAILASSAVTPASVVVADGQTALLTVADTYALPAPGPTPTPGPLPPTGGADLTAWGVGGAALLLAGAIAVLVSLRTRRRA